jgi:hypothetical protein
MKVYTKVKTIEPGSAENNWNGYYEVFYKEYDENGCLIREGSEDFSGIRLRSLARYIVRAYTGGVNRAGQKTTYEIGFIRITKNNKPGTAARFVYGENVARTIKL